MKFWKIYFWIYLVIGIMLMGSYCMQGSPLIFKPRVISPIFLIIATYIIMIVPIFGIYCLAYKKQHLNHIFWKIFFIFYLFNMFRNAVVVNENSYEISSILPIQIITLIGLFIYAFQQNKLFSAAEDKNG